FFQAEDGIRDFHVTGVQTCALPISGVGKSHLAQALGHQAVRSGFTVLYRSIFDAVRDLNDEERYHADSKTLSRYIKPDLLILDRSEERRVGKESRSRGATERAHDRT